MTRTVSAFFILSCAIIGSMLWLDRDLALLLGAIKQTSPQLIAPFAAITTLGKSQWYLYPLGVYIIAAAILARRAQTKTLWLPRLQAAAFVFANVALSGLAVDLCKIIIGRPRPVLLLEDDIFNQFSAFSFTSRWWSFPSGHSATAMSLALSVMALWPHWRWPLLFFAGAIGASRVIVTAHFLSDMLAGFGMAIILFMGLSRLFHLRGWSFWSKTDVKEISLELRRQAG